MFKKIKFKKPFLIAEIGINHNGSIDLAKKLSFVDYYRIRADFYKAIRDHFSKRDFLEVETPTLVKCPGTEFHLGYFSTRWTDYKGKKHSFWLRSSPEIHLKKILSFGLPRIFAEMGFSYPVVFATIFCVFNFHHFLTDRAIWRLRDPKVRQTLVA